MAWRPAARPSGLRFSLSPPRFSRVPSGRGGRSGVTCPASSALDTTTCGALGEAGKPGGDHALAHLQAGPDHGPHVVLLRQRHAPHRDGVVVLDHVDERPVGAALDGGGRHHHHLAQRVDQHPHIDELARPELEIGIGEFGLELHGAGGLIHLIVDHQHLAAVERFLAVGSERVDRQRTFGEALVELRQVLLRQAEEHRDRPHLRDDDDAGGILRLHQVAFVDQADAGAAGDRRDDVGVGEDGARIVDHRLVELDLGFELADQRLLGVELLLVDGVGLRPAGCSARGRAWHWRAAPRPAPSWRPPGRTAPGR